MRSTVRVETLDLACKIADRWQRRAIAAGWRGDDMQFADPEAQKEIDRLRGRLAAVEALLPEWEHYVAEDTAYLNSPNAHYTECQELPAVITVRRENINDLRTALDQP